MTRVIDSDVIPSHNSGFILNWFKYDEIEYAYKFLFMAKGVSDCIQEYSYLYLRAFLNFKQSEKVVQSCKLHSVLAWRQHSSVETPSVGSCGGLPCGYNETYCARDFTSIFWESVVIHISVSRGQFVCLAVDVGYYNFQLLVICPVNLKFTNWLLIRGWDRRIKIIKLMQNIFLRAAACIFLQIISVL